MTLETLFSAWHGFFFEPVSVLPIAVFRIVFGCVLLADALFLATHARYYLAPDGLVSHRRYVRRTYGRAFSLFLVLPGSMTSVRAVLALHICSIMMVIIGFLTPLFAIVMFITTRSIVGRQDHVTNGGDAIAKIMSFLLIFTPSGQALSVDALILGVDAETAAPWAQRLMQIQLCLIYFNTMYWKLKGSTWRNGTAVYYALSNRMYRKVRMPDVFMRSPFIQIMTWGVLALEFALAPGLWIEELRPWLLVAAIGMHIGFGLFLNVHLFGSFMIASLMLFLDPGWITAALSQVGIIP